MASDQLQGLELRKVANPARKHATDQGEPLKAEFFQSYQRGQCVSQYVIIDGLVMSQVQATKLV